MANEEDRAILQEAFPPVHFGNRPWLFLMTMSLGVLALVLLGWIIIVADTPEGRAVGIVAMPFVLLLCLVYWTWRRGVQLDLTFEGLTYSG